MEMTMPMTSKQRVRNAITHKPVDRVPAALQMVGNVGKNLMEKYGLKDIEELYEKFDIDIRYTGPRCTLDLPSRVSDKGNPVKTTYWGYEVETHTFGTESYGTNVTFPLNDVQTIEDVENFNWPKAEWFDYTPITEYCRKHPDKAIMIGHEGPFQIVTNLISMDNFFMLMVDEPEVTKLLLDKMVDFEIDFYEQMFIAGEGQIDVLRTHDDYGTQISTLFSVDMWREFFKDNTKRLVELSHKHGALFQQHSCGAVANIIPELIECGVDSLEPLQPVPGLEPETLQAKYGGQISFHGGVDTQDLLPNGTPEQVKEEAERYIKTLNNNGGYILMASQGFEIDVPLENIEAVYTADRTLTSAE